MAVEDGECMSGITHGWAIIWALGLGLGLVKHYSGAMDITYKSAGALAGKDINQIINNRLPFTLLLLFIFLPASLNPSVPTSLSHEVLYPAT
jgi:hypothetical protein